MIKCRSCGHESESGVHTCEGFKLARIYDKCQYPTCSNPSLGGDTKVCSKHLYTSVTKSIDKQVGGQHYKKHSIQPWHIIDEYKLDFYLGNTVKYVLRTKGNQLEDLEKAVHYLERKIELLKENANQGILDLGTDE